MNKKFLSVLLLVTLFVSLLGVTASAEYKHKIKTMDVTIEAPTVRMSLEYGRKLKLLSLQTEYGELVSTGGTMLVSNIQWSGEFDRDNNRAFKAGMTYTATPYITPFGTIGIWLA